MLKPRKKLTKKELKQDPLFSSLDTLNAYYYDHKKYITYGFLALALLVVGVLIWTNNRRANDEKAATELGKVFSIYDAAATDPRQYKIAIDGQPERGVMGLKSIVDNYGSSQSGELARFYLATAYLHLGQYDDAIRQFDSFSTSSSMLQSAAYAGMGNCYEAKGEYIRAASNFEKAASSAKNTTLSPDYLNSAARCYGLAGEKDKAIALLKRLKKEYPTSSFAREADRYISQFSV